MSEYAQKYARRLEFEIKRLEAEVAKLEAKEKVQKTLTAEYKRTAFELQAVIERMLPKLREHLTEEYILHELIRGGE